MSVQLLISTMHQRNFELLDKMNVSSGAVVVNQCDEESIQTIEYKGNSVIWINTCERGLSKSRNMAIRNATAEYCVLADDDEVFDSNYAETIENAFERNKSFSVIRFKIQGIEKEFKSYSESRYEIGYVKSLQLSSVELAFRREDVVSNNIWFDEQIGAGTENLMGEENAFIFSCLKKHLKICYEPSKLADLHIGNSTWFTGFNEKYFLGRGAAFTAMSKQYSLLLIFQFAVRRYKLYKAENGFIDSIKYMLKGRRRYLKNK